MRSAKLRMLRPVDKVMLIAVVITVGIAALRFAAVAATVPYAAYTSQRLAAEARSEGLPAPRKRISERIAESAPFESWWGERRTPYREGGDHLGVLAQHSPARSLGGAIGVLVEQDNAETTVVERVVVPSDRTALYGEEAGTPMKRADGTEFRSYWAPLARDVSFFSDVPVAEKDYDPVLSAEQAQMLEAEAGLVKRSRDVYVGAAVPGGSGTWVLHVKVNGRRMFILVPIESSPVGEAL